MGVPLPRLITGVYDWKFFFRCSLQSLSSWIVFLNDKAILAPGGFVSWFYITIFSDEAEISVPIWSIWLWVMVWPKSRSSLPGLLTTLMLLNRLSLENIHLLRTWLLYSIIRYYIYMYNIYIQYICIYIICIQDPSRFEISYVGVGFSNSVYHGWW